MKYLRVLLFSLTFLLFVNFSVFAYTGHVDFNIMKTYYFDVLMDSNGNGVIDSGENIYRFTWNDLNVKIGVNTSTGYIQGFNSDGTKHTMVDSNYQISFSSTLGAASYWYGFGSYDNPKVLSSNVTIYNMTGDGTAGNPLLLNGNNPLYVPPVKPDKVLNVTPETASSIQADIVTFHVKYTLPAISSLDAIIKVYDDNTLLSGTRDNDTYTANVYSGWGSGEFDYTVTNQSYGQHNYKISMNTNEDISTFDVYRTYQLVNSDIVIQKPVVGATVPNQFEVKVHYQYPSSSRELADKPLLNKVEFYTNSGQAYQYQLVGYTYNKVSDGLLSHHWDVFETYKLTGFGVEGSTTLNAKLYQGSQYVGESGYMPISIHLGVLDTDGDGLDDVTGLPNNQDSFEIPTDGQAAAGSIDAGDILKNVLSTLAGAFNWIQDFSNLVGQIFSFLPPQIIALLYIAIAGMVVSFIIRVFRGS